MDQVQTKPYNIRGSTHAMKAKTLMGIKVYDRDAIEIGKVADLEINTTSFAVEKIYIKSGLTKQHEVTPQDVDRVGDSVILKVSKNEAG